MAEEERFCDRSLKPWLWTLAALAGFLVLWVLIQREDILVVPEGEGSGSVMNSMAEQGEPAFPGPVRAAAFQRAAAAGTYQLAGLTKATPNGGVQLVANPVAGGFQHSLKDAVNEVLPAVCDIHAIWIKRTYRKPQGNAGNLNFLPPFDGVIDKFIQNKGFENIGAGIIVDRRGYVLTNAHVVKDAVNVMVTVPGEPAQDYNADVIAQDARRDLALVRIRAKKAFPVVRLGNSGFVQIGDYVIAIGSPFGMEQTVTSGIISGVRKSVKIDGLRYKDLLQTDAPINRGSSGGPLVSLSGEVIGVTTAIYAPTGVFNGTGFVIPINEAKAFLTETMGTAFAPGTDKRGLLTRKPDPATTVDPGIPTAARFGIEALTLDVTTALHLGSPGAEGILVNSVFADSPASFAGVKRGDIITALGGVPVRSIQDISKVIPHFKEGDQVHLRVLRNNQADEILVRLW